MQKVITESESYAEVHMLKLNKLKGVLLTFKPTNFKLNPSLNICLNGVPISVETSCRYLGYAIGNASNDNEHALHQLKCFMEGLLCCYIPSELIHVQ